MRIAPSRGNRYAKCTNEPESSALRCPSCIEMWYTCVCFFMLWIIMSYALINCSLLLMHFSLLITISFSKLKSKVQRAIHQNISGFDVGCKQTVFSLGSLFRKPSFFSKINRFGRFVSIHFFNNATTSGHQCFYIVQIN